MRRYVLIVCVLWFGLSQGVRGQGNQALNNGQATTAVNFSGCVYNWVNSNPGIGLTANGTGDISSFKAVNNSNSPVTATITATPKPAEYVYIPASASPGTVTVVNTSTNTITATINVGDGPIGISASPDGSRVYTANTASNNVSVINTSTNTVVATVSVGSYPNSLAVSSDGKKVFIGNVNDGTVSVISTASNTVIATISGFTKPYALAAGTTGSLLYVANNGNIISVVNTATNTIVKNITVGDDPWQIAVNPAGTRVYVTNLVDNSVSVIDAASNTVIATIPVDLTPEGITVSPDGTLLYVGCFNNAEITVINTGNNTVIKKLSANQPHGLSVTPDGKVLYVVNNTIPGSVTAINTSTGVTIATIPTGDGPSGFGNFIAGVSCNPVTFTITVNPSPAFTPTITAGTATGTISACQGAASVSPQVQQIKVSGAAISGNMSATAPTGFEISLSAGAGYGSSLTLVPTAGAVNTTVYVRASATASPGAIAGNVSFTATGAITQSVAVKGVVNTSPTVNTLSNQTVNNGDPTTALNFTGTSNFFTWTNDTPSIGLAGGGTGSIPSFTAINNGTNPVIATVTVTPQKAGLAYISNYGSNTVSVLRTTSNTIVATIPVGAGPWAVSVSPDDSRVYVTNNIGGTVSVINTATNAVIATVAVGSNPDGICVSPDGSRVYVTNLNSGSVSVIDASTNTLVSTISVSPGATGITVSPDGKTLYVVSAASNQVLAINTSNNTVIANIPVGTGATGIAITPDGSKIFVANDVSNDITIINALTNTAITTIAGGVNPLGVAVSPDGSRAYVTNENGINITVINTANNTVVANINTGSGCAGISVTSDGNDIFAVNAGGSVEDISAADYQVKATYNVDTHPVGFGNFITKNGCSGAPVKVTITVDPAPVAPPLITPSAAIGSISACAGTASALPLIQQINIIGSDLTGDITATAPAGFEVSVNEFNGYGATAVLIQNGGAVGSGVFVRSAATAPAGNISGKVTFTSPGATTQQIAVTGIVNAVPKVNTISNQIYTTGAVTSGVTFSGGANNFTWTNDTPGIGLATSGNGNISPFTAVNNASSPVVAHITVTPVNSGAAFVPGYGGGMVSVINTGSNTVEGSVFVGADPIAIAVSPDGTKVFVANHGDNTISVIDPSTNTTVATFFNGTQPNSLTITPDGKFLYVANYGSNTVSVIETNYYQVITDVIVGLGAFGIAASPDSKFVYVANTDSNSVSVISTATNTVVATIPVANGPRGIAVSVDGSKVYVTNNGSNKVTVISTATNSVTGAITVGSLPDNVAVSDDGKLVYVTNNGSGTISVINAATGAVTATITVGSGPSGVSFTTGSGYAYVTNQNDNSVSVINTATNKVVSTIPVGATPISFGNFIVPSNGCPGAPATFTITVNPSVTAPVISTGPVTGTIVACAGSASASPQTEQFTISGSNLIDNITASVPSVFEISTSPNSGFSGSVVLQQTGGTVISTILYVRSTASAPAGIASGYVSISSVGWLQQGLGVPITETINTAPTINPVSNQTVTSGQSTTAVSFSGTGNAFTWTNDTPAIGLPTSGAGDIASFTAINTSNAPLVATVTATPVNGGFAYLTRSDGTVAVFSTTSNEVVSSVTAGDMPAGVILSADGSKAYIANTGSSTVSVINTTTNKVTRTIQVSGGSPIGMAASKNGKWLYVADQTGGQVSVINLATGTETQAIPAGSNAYGVALSPDDSKLYATNFTGGLGSVLVINTATNAVTASVNTELSPAGVVVSPDGTRVYTANQISGSVSVINATTNTFVTSINVGKGATGISISPDGSKLYVSNSGEGTVSVINTATNTEVLKIGVGSNPVGISVNADGSLVYVANAGSQTVSIIDATTNTVVNTVSVPNLSQSFGNFIKNGSGCAGVPAQFTITVNPSAGASPVITALAATGYISACAGTASVSPQIQQINISGSNLKSNITATAPSGFEISLNPNSGYASLLTIKQSAGAVGNIIIYVRASATAPTGNISGDVNIQSFSAVTQTIAVSGVVNAIPDVNPVSNQTVNNNQATTSVNFTGTGSFTWTNDKPGIGLAASGSGNINSFTAVNKGTSPITATVAVTAKSPGYAYITGGRHTGQVYVVNTATQSVVATVPVGSRPYAVAFSPSGDKVYVTNDSTDYVSVIDTKTNKVVDTMYVGINMLSTCISPDGNTLYVTYNYGIAVINTSTGKQITKIFDRSLAQIIASSDGKYVYATNYDFNEVDVISTATNTIIKKIDVGFNPGKLVLSPDEKTLYVTAMGNVRGVVAVVDLAASTLVSSIPLGARPNGITITPDGKKLYVTEEDSNKVAVINTATNQVERTIAVGSYPQGVSVTNDGSEVYITNVNSNDVSIINTDSDLVIKTIPNLNTPYDIGNFIYPGATCSSAPLKFTITVNPTPAQVPTITATTATGNISACQGDASVSPSIQQFTVSGIYLAGDITATAPAGFEVSLTASSGYGPNVKLTQTAGSVANTTIYVRSSASAPAGELNGAVVLTTTTTTQFVDVHGVVNALATIDAVPNQTVNNGDATAAITFGGTGNSFTWTNDTPGIGIAGSSSGNIPSFTARNFGAAPIVATFTVIPEKDALAYIANAGAKTLTVINTKTSKIVATIPVGDFPWGAATSADGRVYVSNSNSNTLSVINSATNTVITTIPLPQAPESLVVSPDGSTVYVVSYGAQTVSVINTSNYTIANTITVGQGPSYMAISADGSKVIVANTGDFNLSVIDTKTNSVTGIIPLTFPPYGIAMGIDNNKVYVDDSDNGNLVAVNIAAKNVIAKVPVGLLPRGVTVSPDGNHVYVGNTGGNTVSVINTASYTVAATVTVGTSPWGMAVTGDGNFVYVADKDDSKVSVISTSTNTIYTSIGVESGPYSIGNFITQGITCPGPPTTFTITVNPTPSTTPNITASAATGVNTACQGTASASPNVQQVSVSAVNLTGAVSLTAPNGFEISLSAGSGFSGSLNLPPVGGALNNVVVYVRLSATAPGGGNSGNIEGTSPGARTIEIPVTGTVNPLQNVNPVGNQSLNNGDVTSAVNFGGTASAFTWTNDTPAIGLAASGSGNIAAFTAVNTGSGAVTATVTVTPSVANYAYVANENSNNVSVVNTVTHTIKSNISVGGGPYYVTSSPDGSTVYVSNLLDGTISVISTKSNTVTGTITVGEFPSAMVISPDGKTLYVANQSSNNISVVNTATNTAPPGFFANGPPNGLAISPDGTRLYVISNYNNSFAVVNTANNMVIATLQVGQYPSGIVLNASGTRAYVTNYSDNTISVVNIVTNTIAATVNVGPNPQGVTISPDGKQVFVANLGDNTISVINAITNSVATTISPGGKIGGMQVSADGTLLYAAGTGAGVLYTVNTSTDAVVANAQVGSSPWSYGSFVVPGAGCAGPSTSFTITVNPTPAQSPGITVGPVTGSISACTGTASASPNIQQFTVSGSNLTAPIVLSGPNNFEISLLPGSGYTNTITLPLKGGTVDPTIIYVRIAATSPAGNNISGDVSLNSSGVLPKKAPVLATVNSAPTVNAVAPQMFNNGVTTTTINFNGTAAGFTWTNDTPAIGLPASGSGDITPFTAVNTGTNPVIATITVTPANNGTGCGGLPVTFTITVNPTLTTAVSATGTLAGLTTVYGTPSASESFSVSGTALTSGILVTPPAGFELSTDNVNFSATVTIAGVGNISPQNVYIRLAAITPVGSYLNNIVVTSPGAADFDLPMPLSTVTPALLAIAADDKSKTFNTPNPPLTASYIGFVNNETVASLVTPPVLTTAALTTSPVGQYPITVSGASSPNYTISYLDGTLTILPTEQSIIIPNTFTPNGDGINDTWNIKFLDAYVNCSVQIFTRWGQRVFTSIGYGIPWDGRYNGKSLPSGTYYYVINLKNGLDPLAGFVALIK